MRYCDFKLVEANLGGVRDDKYLSGINELLKNPDHMFAVGSKGEKGFLIAIPGQQVSSRQDKIKGYMVQNPDQTVSNYLPQLKNSQPQEIQSELKKMNPIMLLKVVDANIANVSNLAKIELQGREYNVLVSTLLKSDEIKLASGTSVSDKEKYPIKPSNIFADEKFSASKVFDEVIQNKILQETEIGNHIIDMAKEIQAGQLPNYKNIPKEFKTAIRDYAGEYLGVLALIKGIANFPTRDQWLEHLDVSSLDDITIYFPQESNNPLGDSEGYFQNKETGNMILISSKGGKKGAPPSITGLKIPDNLKNKNRYKAEVEIVEILQTQPQFEGPFMAINKLYEYAPSTIDPIIASTLPLTNDELAMIKKYTNRKIYNRRDVIELPDKFRKVIGQGPDTKPESAPGGILHYIYSSALIKAINENNALPEFESMAREILQKNFIQIFARPKDNGLGFDILWPNVEMATGKVELYNKSSSTEIKGKLSFSVT